MLKHPVPKLSTNQSTVGKIDIFILPTSALLLPGYQKAAESIDVKRVIISHL